MTAQVLSGAGLAARMREEIARSLAELIRVGGRAPLLATLQVGSDPPAAAYRSSIERTLRRVGIDHRPVDLPFDPGIDHFAAELGRLNGDPEITGILVLMPLPASLPRELVFEHLSPLKDVDGITPTNAGRLHMGLPSLRPSTPQGGIEILDHYGIEVAGRHVVVIGRSNVVGRPFASLVLQRNATVTVCHRRTVDLPRVTRSADVVASAAGQAGLVTANMVRPGAVVVDFGVNVTDQGIVGDVDFESVRHVASGITPVPGGTGPVTALALARNTIAAGFVALSGSLDHADLARAVGTRQVLVDD